MVITKRIFLRGLISSSVLVALPALAWPDGSDTRAYRIWAGDKLIQDKFEVVDKGNYAVAKFKELPLHYFGNEVPTISAEVIIGPNTHRIKGRFLSCDEIIEKVDKSDRGPGKPNPYYTYFATFNIAFAE